jgi:hypothetical protein
VLLAPFELTALTRSMDSCRCTSACHCAASSAVSNPRVKELYPLVANQDVGQWIVTQNCKQTKPQAKMAASNYRHTLISLHRLVRIV